MNFKDKLKTLHFGIVPGAYRDTTSETRYDSDLLDQSNFPDKEEVKDTQSDLKKLLKEE